MSFKRAANSARRRILAGFPERGERLSQCSGKLLDSNRCLSERRGSVEPGSGPGGYSVNRRLFDIGLLAGIGPMAYGGGAIARGSGLAEPSLGKQGPAGGKQSRWL